MLIGLRHGHMGLGYLLVLSSSISVLLALANAALGTKPGLVKVGTILGRRVEPGLMGINSLLGIVVWVLMGIPLTAIYPWLGVGALIVQGALVGMLTKPALVSLAAGDDSARFKWVLAAVLNAVVIIGIFGAMQAKP